MKKKITLLIAKISKHIWCYKKCKGNTTKWIHEGYDPLSFVAQIFITMTSHNYPKFKLAPHNRLYNYKVSLGVSFLLKGYISVSKVAICNSDFLQIVFCQFYSVHRGQTADGAGPGEASSEQDFNQGKSWYVFWFATTKHGSNWLGKTIFTFFFPVSEYQSLTLTTGLF